MTAQICVQISVVSGGFPPIGNASDTRPDYSTQFIKDVE